jgi:hypothetical protein
MLWFTELNVIAPDAVTVTVVVPDDAPHRFDPGT